MEPYYYSHMNKVQKSAYHAMRTGLEELAPSFYVPRLEGGELSDIFFKLRLDYPDIFFVSGFHYRFYQEADRVEMVPEYLFDKTKVKEHRKAMKARVEKLVRPAMSLTEGEKERYIHDFICANVRYDKLKKAYSHEIIGPLGQGVGVCEGIAKTVKALCDALGIWCLIAISDANADKKIKYRHAWNVVKIEGNYYHLDATFDNSLSHEEEIRYDYFNLEDKQFFRDHEPVMYQIPQCSQGGHCYYREKKLSFTKKEDVVKRALQAIKKGKILIFHWRGSYLTRELLAELLELLEVTAGQKGLHAKVALNWHQCIFRVLFTEMTTGEEFIMEEANEGEL